MPPTPPSRPALLEAVRGSPALRFGVAVTTAALAVLLRLAFDPVWGASVPLITFFPAVMVSAWLGGFEPGMVTTLLTTVAGAYFWMPSALRGSAPELMALLMFVGIGVAISALNEAWYRAVRVSERAARAEAEVLGALVSEVNRSLDLDDTLQRIAGAARDLCRADHSRVALREGDGSMVYRHVVGAWARGYEQLKLGPGRGFVGRVLETGRPFRTADAPSDPAVDPEHGRRLIEAEATRTAMVVPIYVRDRIEGLIYVARRTPTPFTDDDERVCTRLAASAAAAIQNAQLFERERVARAAIEAAERHLQLALEAGQMGTWEWTVATGTVRWSAGLEAIHGFGPGGFPGTFEAFRDEIHPEDRSRVLGALADAVERGHDYRIEYRILHADGATRWVEGRGQLFRDAGGRPEQMVGVCSDVTERHQAEDRFRLAVEAAPAAMIVVDRAGTIRFVNAHAEELFGYGRHELVGRAVEDLVPQRFRERHPNDRQTFMAAPSPRPMGAGRDLYAARKDGTEVPVEIGLSPFETDDGVFVLAAVTDISLRKEVEQERARLLALEQQARQEAESANRAKDQFLAVLSHELRTPLTTIVGWLQMLQGRGVPPEQHERGLATMERNARALARMIDDLLDISRIAAGKLTLERRPVDLGALIAEIVESLQPEAGAKGVTLAAHLDSVDGVVAGDADRLRQIVSNLVVNAIRYTPAGGRADVELRADGEAARIVVRDTGIGIDAALLPHVFERFRQADWRSAGTRSGLGLGLAIVREIVEMHGGRVEAESDGPGRGAAFIVTLPTILGEGPAA